MLNLARRHDELVPAQIIIILFLKKMLEKNIKNDSRNARTSDMGKRNKSSKESSG